MIEIAATGSNLRTARYLHHKSNVNCTSSMVIDNSDCCWCTCDTEIPAFADLTNPTDLDRNDFYSWILKVPSNSTVTATLTKIETGVDYVITDNTYGVLWVVDEMATNVWGLKILWYNVANTLGFGTYQMNIQVESGTSILIFDKTYAKFKLMPYTCSNAHYTVRIETHNSGYIEGGFDYRNLSITIPATVESAPSKFWKQQIRWYGRFEVSGIPTQIDNIYDNYRNLIQVQTQIENEYNLRLEFIKTDISKQLIYDNLLADFIIVSDYNSNNVDDYKNIKCSLLNIENPQNFKNRTQIFNVKLVPYKQNNLKRFY